MSLTGDDLRRRLAQAERRERELRDLAARQAAEIRALHSALDVARRARRVW